jgi:hypothetical protein
MNYPYFCIDYFIIGDEVEVSSVVWVDVLI